MVGNAGGVLHATRLKILRRKMMAETATAASESAEEVPVRELCVNGTCVKTDEFEAKLDEGNIEEAESSLRETFSLSSEVSSFIIILNMDSNFDKFNWEMKFSRVLVGIVMLMSLGY